jgi:hypothetical protein
MSQAASPSNASYHPQFLFVLLACPRAVANLFFLSLLACLGAAVSLAPSPSNAICHQLFFSIFLACPPTVTTHFFLPLLTCLGATTS